MCQLPDSLCLSHTPTHQYHGTRHPDTPIDYDNAAANGSAPFKRQHHSVLINKEKELPACGWGYTSLCTTDSTAMFVENMLSSRFPEYWLARYRSVMLPGSLSLYLSIYLSFASLTHLSFSPPLRLFFFISDLSLPLSHCPASLPPPSVSFSIFLPIFIFLSIFLTVPRPSISPFSTILPV